MAETRDRAEWSKLSVLLATIGNWAGKVCEKPITPDDCNPYATRRSVTARPVPYDPSVLQAMQDCGRIA